MFATGETVGLAERIIDDTCLARNRFEVFKRLVVILSVQGYFFQSSRSFVQYMGSLAKFIYAATTKDID